MRRTIGLACFIAILVMQLVAVNSVYFEGGAISSKGAGLKVFSRLAPVYPVAKDVGLNVTDDIIIQNIGDEPLLISLSYSLSPQELQGMIYVRFTRNNFVLDPSMLEGVGVNIIVEQGAYVGVYELSITVKGQAEVGEGNPIVVTSVISTMIMVGQYSYNLTVRLKQPDGTPTMGLIKVSFYYQGGYIPLYQVKSSNYTFHVIEGRYLVEAFLGGMKRASQEVDVYQDTVVSLTYSSIYIKNLTVLLEPKNPRDSLVFKIDVQNDDPLIYHKEIAVTVNLRNESGIVVRNQTIAQLTIRSLVTKEILGFVRPPDYWANGTYRLEVLLYSKSKILYNYTADIHVVVIAPISVQYIQQIPFHYILLLTIVGMLFGFFGAKFALIRLRGKLLPKTVGLLYGKDYVAYNVLAKIFEDPEFISGDWNKALYSFRILAQRYLRSKKKEEKAKVAKFIVVTLNAEKWIFVPLIQEITMFLCIQSGINEYDILDKIEKLVGYFKSKISTHGIHALLLNPEDTLDDLARLIAKLF